jgi:hypothetical protein
MPKGRISNEGLDIAFYTGRLRHRDDVMDIADVFAIFVIFAVHKQWARCWCKPQVVGHARNVLVYTVEFIGLVVMSVISKTK